MDCTLLAPNINLQTQFSACRAGIRDAAVEFWDGQLPRSLPHRLTALLELATLLTTAASGAGGVGTVIVGGGVSSPVITPAQSATFRSRWPQAAAALALRLLASHSNLNAPLFGQPLISNAKFVEFEPCTQKSGSFGLTPMFSTASLEAATQRISQRLLPSQTAMLSQVGLRHVFLNSSFMLASYTNC